MISAVISLGILIVISLIFYALRPTSQPQPPHQSSIVGFALIIWWIAIITYGIGMLTESIIFLDLLLYPLAIFLFHITGLPVPFGLIFSSAPRSVEMLIVFTGWIGVIAAISAAFSLWRNKAKSWTFIILSMVAYIISIGNIFWGNSCVFTFGNYAEATVSCLYGVLPAVPNFAASTVLLISALVIKRYVRVYEDIKT